MRKLLHINQHPKWRWHGRPNSTFTSVVYQEADWVQRLVRTKPFERFYKPTHDGTWRIW
jgi:hypothetical protein